MSEAKAKKLIEKAGFKTFSRPKGIPENYNVVLSDKGCGIKYVHPTDKGTFVRVMPGKPHSPYPSQRKPYVSELKQGNAIDRFGNRLNSSSEIDAHIPLAKYKYLNRRK